MMKEINEDAGNAVRDLLQEYVVSPISTKMDEDQESRNEILDAKIGDNIEKFTEDIKALSIDTGIIKMVQKKNKEKVEGIFETMACLKRIKSSCSANNRSCGEIKQEQKLSQMRTSRQNERICGKIERNAKSISNSLAQIQQAQIDTDKRIQESKEVFGGLYNDLQKKTEDTKNVYKQGNDDIMKQISESQKSLNRSVQENLNKQHNELYEEIQALIGDIDRKLIFENVIQHLDKVEKQSDQNRERLSRSISEKAEIEENHQHNLEAAIERNFKELGSIMESQHNAVNAVLEKKYGVLLKITLLLGGMNLIGVIAVIVMQIM